MTDEIIQIVSNVTGVSVENILIQDRYTPYADARKIAMSLCRDYTNSTWHNLRDVFKRDHATVIHACNETKRFLQVDSVFADKYLKAQREVRKLGLRKIVRKVKVKSILKKAA